MSAHEFSEWHRIWSTSEADEFGEDPIGDMAWRAMDAIVERMERHPGDIEDAARELAPAICWAAFWLAAAAVLTVAIWRFA